MSTFNKDLLIRNRINDNLLKVRDESSEVKSLLSLGVQTTKPNNSKYAPNDDFSIFHDLNLAATCTSRKELLRTCILLATSRNTVAQENLMDVICLKLGRIKGKDYRYIANLIYLKDARIVETVNNYLSQNLEGFNEMHKKYCHEYYGF